MGRIQSITPEKRKICGYVFWNLSYQDASYYRNLSATGILIPALDVHCSTMHSIIPKRQVNSLKPWQAVIWIQSMSGSWRPDCHKAKNETTTISRRQIIQNNTDSSSNCPGQHFKNWQNLNPKVAWFRTRRNGRDYIVPGDRTVSLL